MELVFKCRRLRLFVMYVSGICVLTSVAHAQSARNIQLSMQLSQELFKALKVSELETKPISVAANRRQVEYVLRDVLVCNTQEVKKGTSWQVSRVQCALIGRNWQKASGLLPGWELVNEKGALRLFQLLEKPTWVKERVTDEDGNPLVVYRNKLVVAINEENGGALYCLMYFPDKSEDERKKLLDELEQDTGTREKPITCGFFADTQ